MPEANPITGPCKGEIPGMALIAVACDANSLAFFRDNKTRRVIVMVRVHTIRFNSHRQSINQRF